VEALARHARHLESQAGLYACVFGSAARQDGDASSDIDLLLVHPPHPGESDPRPQSGGTDAIAGLAAEFTAEVAGTSPVSPRPRKGAHATGLPRPGRTRQGRVPQRGSRPCRPSRDRRLDAICCARLGRRRRGDNHRSTVDILRQATPDGGKLALTLLRLLDLKDAAHYGVMIVAARRGRDALNWASRLVERARGQGPGAREETER
jgi:hypothetical protein